ncbi:MAG: cell division protein FtsA, partial [Thermodesulfovibrionia bacterium]|nr:cell division protein FtsA [Thermodesulfovibrionia bacterium]
ELPVRIGIPKCIDGVKNGVSNPAYSTGAGLVLYGAREALAEYKFSNANLFNGLRTRMRGLVNKIVNLRR